MMVVLEKMARLWDKMIASTFWGIMWALLACTVLSAGNAFIRKITGYSSNGLLELQWMLFSGVFLLGAAYLLQQDGHIRIDVFYQKRTARQQALINFTAHLCLSLPFFALLTAYTIPFWLASFMPEQADNSFLYYLFVNQTYFEYSANAGGLPTPFAKMLLPAGFGLLTIQTVSELIKYAGQLGWFAPADTASVIDEDVVYSE